MQSTSWACLVNHWLTDFIHSLTQLRRVQILHKGPLLALWVPAYFCFAGKICIFTCCIVCTFVPSGITGILMSAAALPVCLIQPPKLVLHPPTVSKNDIKPIPGLSHCCRKTSKKQARKGASPHLRIYCEPPHTPVHTLHTHAYTCPYTAYTCIHLSMHCTHPKRLQ